MARKGARRGQLMAQLRILLGALLPSIRAPVSFDNLASKQRTEFSDRSCPAQIHRMPAWISPVRVIWSTVVDATGNVPALFIIRGSRFMKSIKPILTASFILGTTAIAATGPAEARHLRHAGGAYAVTAGACSDPGPRPTTYIYPAPNWEPFFRRHVYRYGPILICEPVLQATNVISVRY